MLSVVRSCRCLTQEPKKCILVICRCSNLRFFALSWSRGFPSAERRDAAVESARSFQAGLSILQIASADTPSVYAVCTRINVWRS